MNLAEMRQLLERNNIELTKSLGQNFLHDANQLRRIADAARIEPGDSILEIGPGLGPLTEVLLPRAARVKAIEKDSRLVTLLRKRWPNEPKLELIQGDALRLVEDRSIDWSDWLVVSNLPYSVASPILVELAQTPLAPRRVTVTLQREVAERLVAKTDADQYGILSLLVQLKYRPGEMFFIGAKCFFPPPDVESACITMERRPEPLLDASQTMLFARIVKLAFSQRRKMMLKLLKQNWPLEELTAAFARLDISQQERAEKVSLPQFVELTKLLATSTPSA